MREMPAASHAIRRRGPRLAIPVEELVGLLMFIHNGCGDTLRSFWPEALDQTLLVSRASRNRTRSGDARLGGTSPTSPQGLCAQDGPWRHQCLVRRRQPSRGPRPRRQASSTLLLRTICHGMPHDGERQQSKRGGSNATCLTRSLALGCLHRPAVMRRRARLGTARPARLSSARLNSARLALGGGSPRLVPIRLALSACARTGRRGR